MVGVFVLVSLFESQESGVADPRYYRKKWDTCRRKRLRFTPFSKIKK